MKKFLLSIIFFLAGIVFMQAQTLFGTTREGGPSGAGVINKFMPATNTLTVARSFESFGVLASQTFIERSDGKIYGVTRSGGYGGSGGIFSYDPSTSAFTILKIVDATTNGFFPIGSLVQGTDGKLYGMTYRISGVGGIFSFDPLSSTVTTIKDFDAADGAPQGSLVQAGNGKLYGMTGSGGIYNFGIIFSFDPSTATYTILKDMDGSHNNGLVRAGDGKLYGVTWSGGNKNYGAVFSVDITTAVYTPVMDFDASNAGRCYASLVQANDGKLYGMKWDGGTSDAGFIFSYDPSASTYSKKKDFDLVGGARPQGELMQSGDGKLYGMTSQGGIFNFNWGVIFSFDPSNSVYKVLKDFDQAANPVGGLLQASNGKLYGLTLYGGGNYDFEEGAYLGHGIIFSFDPVFSSYTALQDNTVSKSGQYPQGSLILAGDGKLYGTTTNGGNGYGAIYSFDTLTSAYTKLKDFDFTNGARPCGIMQAADGKMYGMTSFGGSGNHGVIFSFDPSTSVYKKLMDFDNVNGGHPMGNFIQAIDGKLYGMTLEGGTSNDGVIFSFDPSTAVYSKLTDFNTIDGGHPVGSLMQASNGKLYGMTFAAIFSFDPSTSTYTRIRFFGGTDGTRPNGSLVQASNGKLYGLTSYGGNLSGNNGSGFGTLFAFDPLTDTYTKLIDFDGVNGALPYGSLMQASDGKLYGVTNGGGINKVGVIFSFDPVSSAFKKLKDYDGTNGAYPALGAAFIELPECTTSFAFYKDADGDGYGDPYSMKIALKQPRGYAANNTDCDDKNKAVHPETYYRDADEDNLGDANVSISICNPISPAGFVKNKNDNDDHRKLQYALSNYPNPFETISTIKYDIPFDSKVSLKVYDLLGRVVATLVNEEDKKTGIYKVDFKAVHSNTRFLYYKIIAKSKDRQFEQTNKMIQIK